MIGHATASACSHASTPENPIPAVRRRDAGLTLLEFAVALCMLGVLMVLSIPNLVRYLDLRQLSLADTQVISDLRAAADRARTQHVLVRVTFAAGSGSYTVDSWRPGPGGDPCDASVLPIGQGTWITVERDRLPPRLVVTATPTINPFVFACRGTPDDPSTGAPILPTNNPLRVTITNATGSRSIAVDMGGRVQ